MTEVAFHFNAPDKWAYACRLLRKAVNAGARVVVCAEQTDLERLDELLWTFAPLEFLPHCLSNASAQELSASPIILANSITPEIRGVLHRVLLNLGQHIVNGFESFDRVIEVVTLDDADRQTARTRWKHYADRGYQITRHDLKLKSETA
jgi:DNA polymerase-3 subunit chi